MPRAALITGGNEGDIEANIRAAAAMTGSYIGRIVAASGIHRSRSWGFEAEDFLNQVIIVDTVLSPMELLEAVQGIERELGRDRSADTGYDDAGRRLYRSRTMDIDILFYDDLRLDSPSLTIPHPQIMERDFVLVPLREVEDELGDKIRPVYESLKKTLSL